MMDKNYQSNLEAVVLGASPFAPGAVVLGLTADVTGIAGYLAAP